ncbi:tubulin-like doman-containing protein [Solwaraspora sp. WMMD406]|uniref:tubulin-like doman-containing protein n=1 Tax=Solwaraspora sp. WMMD406 TaxID=3016095 RepID=UPI002416E1BC|nr:tubulin-like doman-containing protein [Solwaraspora sp. WMMD406]MDG4766872.1 tubulin-like doman-containing protein [Solwaraspora sp. WMMD406]
MKIFQPMLYVGLGGTGCLVGAELERRLREELCGPDGTDLQEVMAGENFQPFQLPACLQFVYGDLSDAELARLPRQVVPSDEHLGIVDRTQQRIRDLVPKQATYPEVARSLRTNLYPYVRDWLPDAAGEPRIGPLPRGAGQLPTVGRAALFETMRHGVTPIREPLREAIGRISKSGSQISQLNGRVDNTCDVFVSFSVAGGTGCGIFYDFLHLIGHTLQQAGFRPQIYPLVLMPSAFEDGLGGGRRAMLNSGRALLDLFRLVDDQNGQAAGTQLDDFGTVGSVGVRYPALGEVRLRPSTVQTAFLFSRPPGVEPSDLHRSVVSLMLSLVGTDHDEAGEHVGAADRLYQSFADEFINKGVDREIAAASGVGNRGVSTALVASMTVPVDELADIIASRILSEAVTELSTAPPGRAEANRPLIERFFGMAHLDPLRTCAPMEFAEVAPERGHEAVTAALRTRARTMLSGLDALDQQLASQMPALAQRFDPRRAAEQLIGEIDVFRLHRVVSGDPSLADPADRLGFIGLVESRRSEPAAPDGVEVKPPLPAIEKRLMRSVRWSDPDVQDCLERQDRWYRWRTRRAWHAAWAEQTTRWERPLAALRRDLLQITGQFAGYAQRNDIGSFNQRAKDLYRPRTGVSYLLPPQGSDLEPFYQATLRRFVSYYVAQGRLRPTATPGDIVREVVGAEGWRQCYVQGWQRGADNAVALVSDRIKQAVKRLFRYQTPDEQPLLPALSDLLTAAADKPAGPVGDDDLTQFRHKIAGLVPGGFSPQGTGPLKVLISYAAGSRDSEIEAYLENRLNLPRESGAVRDFRSVDAESIVVVLVRTSMSVTEVPELRGVLRQWSDAVHHEEPQDYLRWRQRLGDDSGYLMTTPEHRTRILHRLLCALWNGQIEVLAGDEASPVRIRVGLGQRQSVSMTLDLHPFERASSWGGLLRAYEEWTIADDDVIRQDFAEKLMTTRPHDLDSAPARPSKLYQLVRQIAEDEVQVLDQIGRQIPRGNRALDLRREFWARTFPGALDMPFEAVSNPVRDNLRELEEALG